MKTTHLKKFAAVVLSVIMTVISTVPAAAVTVSDSSKDGEATYYFLAPDNYFRPEAGAVNTDVGYYYSAPAENASWPGEKMTPAPEVHPNAFKCTIPVSDATTPIIFNSFVDAGNPPDPNLTKAVHQTNGLWIENDDYNNQIIVLDLKSLITNEATGSTYAGGDFFSLDTFMDSDNYKTYEFDKYKAGDEVKLEYWVQDVVGLGAISSYITYDSDVVELEKDAFTDKRGNETYFSKDSDGLTIAVNNIDNRILIGVNTIDSEFGTDIDSRAILTFMFKVKKNTNTLDDAFICDTSCLRLISNNTDVDALDDSDKYISIKYFKNNEGYATYYFLAPDNYFRPEAGAANTDVGYYYWSPVENASWPGEKMTPAPEVHPNAFKVTMPDSDTVPAMVFNSYVDAGSPADPALAAVAHQTTDIWLDTDDYNNMIFVLDLDDMMENPLSGAFAAGGDFFSLDDFMDSDNYKTYGFDTTDSYGERDIIIVDYRICDIDGLAAANSVFTYDQDVLELDTEAYENKSNSPSWYYANEDDFTINANNTENNIEISLTSKNAETGTDVGDFALVRVKFKVKKDIAADQIDSLFDLTTTTLAAIEDGEIVSLINEANDKVYLDCAGVKGYYPSQPDLPPQTEEYYEGDEIKLDYWVQDVVGLGAISDIITYDSELLELELDAFTDKRGNPTWFSTDIAGLTTATRHEDNRIEIGVKTADPECGTDIEGRAILTFMFKVKKDTNSLDDVFGGNISKLILISDGNTVDALEDADKYISIIPQKVEKPAPPQPEPYDGYATYYFLAPDNYFRLDAGAANTDVGYYYWSPVENASWPGEKMTPAPEVHPNAFKVTMPDSDTVFAMVINSYVDAGSPADPALAAVAHQTTDIWLDTDDYNNMIFVLDLDNMTENPFSGALTASGDFFPLDTFMDSDNYKTYNFSDSQNGLSGQEGDIIEVEYFVHDLKALGAINAVLTYDTDTFELYEGFKNNDGSNVWYSLNENTLTPVINAAEDTIKYAVNTTKAKVGTDCTNESMFKVQFEAKKDFKNAEFPIVTKRLKTIENGKVCDKLNEKEQYIHVSVNKVSKQPEAVNIHGETFFETGDMLCAYFTIDYPYNLYSLNTVLEECESMIEYDSEYLEHMSTMRTVLEDVYDVEHNYKGEMIDISITNLTADSDYYFSDDTVLGAFYFKVKKDIMNVQDVLSLKTSSLSFTDYYTDDEDEDGEPIGETFDAIDQADSLVYLYLINETDYYETNIHGDLEYETDDRLEIDYTMDMIDNHFTCSSVITYDPEYLSFDFDKEEEIDGLTISFDTSKDGIIEITVNFDTSNIEDGLNFIYGTILRLNFKVLKDIDNVRDIISLNTTSLKSISSGDEIDLSEDADTFVSLEVSNYENYYYQIPDDEMATYYFLAPDSYFRLEAGAINTDVGYYYWIPDENAAWPGEKMTPAPEVHPNAFKVTMPNSDYVPALIFNSFVDAGIPEDPELAKVAHQTRDVYVDTDDYNNMIYVLDLNNMEENPFSGALTAVGDFFTLDNFINSYNYSTYSFIDPSVTPEPEDPDNPKGPEDPTTKPTEPEEPEKPDVIATPDNPTPVNPEPETPDKPETPDNPEPTKPEPTEPEPTEPEPTEPEPTEPEPTEPELTLIGIMGDMDGNGKVDSGDSLFVLRASVSLEELTDTLRILADVDGDNKISSSDSLYILRASVKLEDGLNIGTEKYIAK